jgi:hypothetical protein
MKILPSLPMTHYQLAEVCPFEGWLKWQFLAFQEAVTLCRPLMLLIFEL